jgi:hypothetical protein
MREVQLSARGVIDADLTGRLGAELRALRTLGDVLSWGRRQQPKREVAEIVTQDEYTHDVIVGWDANVWLVFDTT